jgi:uncharacterized protein YdhG (YjbR/CyaY superfamily)
MESGGGSAALGSSPAGVSLSHCAPYAARMATPVTVDEYIAGFPPDVRERLERVRTEIVASVQSADGGQPEEKMRYGIAAVMLGGRYALHFAGWKKHIGLYPVPRLSEPLESEIAPYRAEKDTVSFPHAKEIPYGLIGRVTTEIVRLRATSPNASAGSGRRE